MIYRIFLPVIIAAAVVAAPAPTTTPTVSKPVSFADYRLLTDRNIFSRSRTRTSGSRSSYYSTPETPSSPKSTNVLTGVIREGGSYIAFIENVRRGTTQRYHVGDSVAEGKIAAVGIDSIDFSDNGQTRRIEVGHNMTGAAFVAPSPLITSFSSSPSGGVPTTAPAGGSTSATPSDASSGSPDDIIQRMKQRHLQETKQ